MATVDPLVETCEAFRLGELRALDALQRERALPVTGDRLLASLACHIDHDEPPGLAAQELATVVMELLDGVADYAALFELHGALVRLKGKFRR